MSIEIRSVTADELPEFQRVPRYVFGDTRSEEARGAEPNIMRPEWTTAGFVDGRIATSFAAFPFRVKLNGATTAMAGVTAVGTLPEYRRSGLLRQIMSRSFEEQRERGQAFAILWASFAAIYQRFGYGLATARLGYDIDPREIAFAEGAPSETRVRLVPRDEAEPIVKALYAEWSAPRNMAIVRSRAMWGLRLTDPPDSRNEFGVALRDGEPRGYLHFRFHRGDDGEGRGMRVDVLDLLALDADAYRGLWEFLAVHDLVGRVRWGNAPADDPAPWLMIEPRRLNQTSGDAIWLRVVDVAAGLTQRPYSAPGRLVLRVIDPMCGWNDDVFEVETTGPESRCHAVADEPDLTVPVRSLAMLASGQASATQLERARLLAAVDPKALTLADRMFATSYAPWCGDNF